MNAYYKGLKNMKKPANSSETSSKDGSLRSILDLIPWVNFESVARVGIFFFIGLVGASIVGWVIFPMVLYSKQPQPINFSHVVHLDSEKVDGVEGETKAEKCLYCHLFYEDGTFGGIPKLESCIECHDDPESPQGESPGEQAFLTDYVAEEKEVPWFVYSKQPDCVYFSHIPHVKMANLECATCHGKHSETDQLPLYEENRLTGYSRNIWGKRLSGIYFKKEPYDRMKMDDCAECHTKKDRKENNACFVCHK
jgi:hypothetical protein